MRYKFVNNQFTDSYEYAGAYTYENQSQLGHNLHFMSLAGQRLVDNNGVKEFEYSTSDHLGNTRQMFTLNSGVPHIKQDNHYYAFGMQIDELKSSSTNTNRLTYNNKEKDLDLGWYHYGARFYDPAVGRWWSVDPVDVENSAYNYSFNNPILFVDPDGMVPDIFVNGEKHTSPKKPAQFEKTMTDAAWNWLWKSYGNSMTNVHFIESTKNTIAQTTFRKKGNKTTAEDLVNMAGKKGIFAEIQLNNVEFLIHYNSKNFIDKQHTFDHEFNHIIQYTFLIKNKEPILPGWFYDGTVINKSYEFSPNLPFDFLDNNRTIAKTFNSFELWRGGNIEWFGFNRPTEAITPAMKAKIE